jgi:hypothetical protein
MASRRAGTLATASPTTAGGGAGGIQLKSAMLMREVPPLYLREVSPHGWGEHEQSVQSTGGPRGTDGRSAYRILPCKPHTNSES